MLSPVIPTLATILKNTKLKSRETERSRRMRAGWLIFHPRDLGLRREAAANKLKPENTDLPLPLCALSGRPGGGKSVQHLNSMCVNISATL